MVGHFLKRTKKEKKEKKRGQIYLFVALPDSMRY